MSVQDVYNNVFSTFHSVREYLAPVLKDSKFKETGCLTPEEFMAAGEFLVYKCPTWSWESGLNEKKRDYLAPDKQFLVTRNVPCLHRASQMEYTDDDNETQFIHNSSPATNEEDGWMYTHSSRVNAMENITHTIIGEEEEVERRLAAVTLETKPEEVPDMDDIPDMDDVFEEEEEEEDLARADTSRKQDNDNILQVRTYDVFITYDKYYQTPRVWLFGYDEVSDGGDWPCLTIIAT
ncbi:autophagocytosis associated protein [Spinellus fusiger]|nr:autophagocytosis associated protein [Spinellus fusiger]